MKLHPKLQILYRDLTGISDNISFYQRGCLLDGSPWLSSAKVQNGYLFRFHSIVDILFNPSDHQIFCHPLSNTSDRTVEHLVNNQILPFVYAFYGSSVIHASACLIPLRENLIEGRAGEAVAFVGETGQGKSTLIGSFCEMKSPLVADDWIILEEQDKRIIGYASTTSIRLWSDSAYHFYGDLASLFQPVADYSSKIKIMPEEGNLSLVDYPVPIKHMYFLANSVEQDANPSINIRPLSSQEAFVELLQNSFRLDITDKERIRQEFEVLSQMARYPIYFRLSYPRDYSRLPDVRQAILDHLQA